MNVSGEEFAMLDEVVSSIYNRGIKDGMEVSENMYQQGLNDAWECARKINDMYYQKLNEVFPDSTHDNIFIDYSAQEAMQKIKEYEERQKDDEKSCGTCKHVMRIVCGAYPCNECPRDTLPKWEPKQDEKCEKCTKEISAECVVDGCEFEPKQTDATDIDIGSIKIGDEIVDGQGRKVIVTQLSKLDGKDILKGFDGEGCPWNAIISNIWYKTGRHFPQIAEVLELLEG